MSIYTNPRRRVVHDPHPTLRDATAVSRFWSLVDRGPDDTCWPWLGDTSKGYGVFTWGGTVFGAHELALSFTTGERRIPSLDTCHSCDNPICCNPAHLRFDSRAANVADMVSRGRASRALQRLSDEQVRTIRERRAAGARQCDLARDFGVTDGWISELVRGIRRPQAGGPFETERQYIRG